MIADLSKALREVVDPRVSLVVLRQVGSTNDLARRVVGEYVDDGARQPRAVVVALAQQAGRGRAGRRWESPADAGLYFSILRALPRSAPSLLPLALATALASALEPFLPVRPLLKWPNDLLTPKGKVSGILVEAVKRGSEVHGVVGVGVNLRLDPALPATAAALGGGRLEPTPGAVAAAVVQACWSTLGADTSLTDVVERWLAGSAHRVGDAMKVRHEETVVEGTFLGLHHDGRLILGVGGEERLISSGDVTVPNAVASEGATGG